MRPEKDEALMKLPDDHPYVVGLKRVQEQGIKRYKLRPWKNQANAGGRHNGCYTSGDGEIESPTGNWVRYEDIKQLLKDAE